MAIKDPTGAKWATSAKADRKKLEKLMDEYYDKFVGGKATPTKADAERMTKIYKAYENMATLMWKDYQEMGQVITGLGGGNDAAVRSYATLANTVAKKAK